MSENSKIEWCDHTFNPWIGCTKVSPACDHCYAERSTPARALGIEWGTHAPRYRTAAANWQKPITWNNRPFYACRVCGWRGHRAMIDDGTPVCPNPSCLPVSLLPARPRVFCASLADVFDNAVDLLWRRDLFKLIADTPNLDWLLLTKRIGNVPTMLRHIGVEQLPDNVWLGATIVNQEEAERDIPKLLAVPARVRFLSMEPLLGPVDLTAVSFTVSPGYIGDALQWHHQPHCSRDERYPAVDWVIVGGESGQGARPMHPDWARDLRDQCTAAGVPFLFKQWGEWLPVEPNGSAIRGCGVTPVREPAFRFAANHHFTKVGKRAAGRYLDGRTHDEFPALAWRRNANG
ncbi:protein gp37 [Burkholderia cepacia]|uniref:phage Gp37/Gp68 family protein n=1 Tax=Burkholderia cepacia TaxID=292 RepID=UPI0008D679C2|nr:phage Gp37/Gp68 family protein [Burkholderia cepacia]SEU36429.1 protein gp37 [Burkholderia cepacia]